MQDVSKTSLQETSIPIRRLTYLIYAQGIWKLTIEKIFFLFLQIRKGSMVGIFRRLFQGPNNKLIFSF